MAELLSIKLGIEGVDEINAKLGLAVDRIQNPYSAHKEAVESVVVPWLRRRFQSGGSKGWKSSNFAGWKHYFDEPVYLARKQRMLGVSRRKTMLAPLLWRKGRATKTPLPHERLFGSFVGDPGLGRSEHVRIYRRTGFTVGSSVPYAADHQFGRGPQIWDLIWMPRRQIIVGDPKLVRALVNGYQKWVSQHIDGGVRSARVILSKADARRAFRNA